MQKIGEKLTKRADNKLNCIVKNELADKILSQKYYNKKKNNLR